MLLKVHFEIYGSNTMVLVNTIGNSMSTVDILGSVIAFTCSSGDC